MKKLGINEIVGLAALMNEVELDARGGNAEWQQKVIDILKGTNDATELSLVAVEVVLSMVDTKTAMQVIRNAGGGDRVTFEEFDRLTQLCDTPLEARGADDGWQAEMLGILKKPDEQPALASALVDLVLSAVDTKTTLATLKKQYDLHGDDDGNGGSAPAATSTPGPVTPAPTDPDEEEEEETEG